MIGSDFPESTTKLGAPEGMDDEVYALPVWHTPGHPAFISHWRMSWRERFHCLIFGYVWLHVLSQSHPPVAIETHHPFEEPEGSSDSKTSSSIFAIVLMVALSLGSILFLYLKGEL